MGFELVPADTLLAVPCRLCSRVGLQACDGSELDLVATSGEPLAWCPSCTLVQTLAPVSVTETSPTPLPATAVPAAEVVGQLRTTYPLPAESLVLEISTSEPQFLPAYRQSGLSVMGLCAGPVDQSDLPLETGLFHRNRAWGWIRAGRRPQVIHLNQILSRVSDLNEFAAACALLLPPDGLLVIEEHLRTGERQPEEPRKQWFTLVALRQLLGQNGLEVVEIQSDATGARLIAAATGVWPVQPSVGEWLAWETEWVWQGGSPADEFNSPLASHPQDLPRLLKTLKSRGKRIAVSVDSARDCDVLSALGLESSLVEYILAGSDPGGLKVFSPDGRIADPDYCLLLTEAGSASQPSPLPRSA